MATPIVTFCGNNKLIVVCCLPCTDLQIDAQINLYSHWKKAIIDGCLDAGYLHAFETTGGDAVTASQNLSGYFFLVNGWRVKPAEKDQSYLVEGNLFVCGGVVHPFVNSTGCFNTFVSINTSAQSLTTSTITLSCIGNAAVADAVWDESLACHTTAGSAGITLASTGSITIDDIPTKQDIANQVWSTELPGCFEIDTAGQRLSDASDCIDALLGSIATTNWSEAEKGQIRDALGVDGTKVDSTGGVIQKIKNKVNTIFALLFK